MIEEIAVIEKPMMTMVIQLVPRERVERWLIGIIQLPFIGVSINLVPLTPKIHAGIGVIRTKGVPCLVICRA
ncbi:hypothetical protein [Sphingorhabdus sp.]|uniref:hypothetical protein n=1 Tax=Sphingorhabdus sp. TaxID=1902408 RepID=UPI0035B3A162